MLKRFTRLSLSASLSFFLFASAIAQTWKPIPREKMTSGYTNFIKPARAATFEMDLDALRSEWASAPEELEGKQVKTYGKVVAIPMPDGSFQHFRIVRYHMMEPELRSKWAFAQTWLGQGVEDPAATLHADITAQGFHCQILSPKGNAYTDPVFLGDTRYVQVYRKSDLDPASKGPFVEEADPLDEGHLHEEEVYRPGGPTVLANGDTRRVYRIAIAATAEYTGFHGGATGAASAIVTSLNRVNGVYERELSIRMILVANNNLLIYTNSSTDPYANGSGPTMLGQNQTNVTAVIGTNAYDIGHVFSTGGGGIAGFGVVCNNSSKARGVTGSSSPVNDPFDIDYVAHEIGHQFGGSHTFNSVTGSCSGNRANDSAFEPGSGTTIMAYAGICGSDNTQNNSNDYFNFRSLDQILTFSQTGGGNSCPNKIPTGNVPPVVPAVQGGFVIPISTPFRLQANPATDANSDTLTYCWEQSDLGPAGAPGAATGNAPLFRSFSPVSITERVFPRWANLLNNNTTLGERLPNYARNMTFRLSVRDNNTGAGGVTFQSVSLSVNATGGAFSVTAPNLSSVQWEAGTTQTVTWNAGSTASAPFNTPRVRIRLSTDGGVSWPFILKDSVANDGSEPISVPAIPSTTCRVMVEAIGNVFFDVSNANFRITPPTVASIGMVLPAGPFCAGQTVRLAISPNGTTYNAGNVFQVQISGANGQFINPQVIGSLTSALSTGTDSVTLTIPPTLSGTGYKIRIVTSNPVRTSTQILDVPQIRPLPSAPPGISGPATLCSGDSTGVFSIPAQANTGYQWTLPAGSQILSNPDSNAVRIRFAGTQGQVSVRLRNTCGLGPAGNFLVSPIVILPANVTATASSLAPCTGTTVTFNTTVSNGGLTPQFRWFRNDTLIEGASASSLQVPAQGTGNRFKVVLLSSLFCGTPNVDTSNILVVNAQQRRTPTAAIESNTLNDTSCTGEAITFTSSVVLAGGTSPQYAWFRNLTQITGQTTNTLVLNNLTSADSIRLRLTVTGNCLTANTIFSRGIRTTIVALAANAGPDTSLCRNDSLFLVGTPPGGQWTGNGIAGGNEFDPTTTGNTTLTYTIQRWGCIRTDSRVITVLPVPTLGLSMTNPNELVASPTNGASSWIWFRDGVEITGATDSVYTITADGEYCVQARFGACVSKSPCLPFTYTGLGKTQSAWPGLQVFPNPSNGKVHIQSGIPLAEVVFFNSLGQEMHNISISNENGLNVDLSRLPSGLYHLRIRSRNGNETRIPLLKK